MYFQRCKNITEKSVENYRYLQKNNKHSIKHVDSMDRQTDTWKDRQLVGQKRYLMSPPKTCCQVRT